MNGSQRALLHTLIDRRQRELTGIRSVTEFCDRPSLTGFRDRGCRCPGCTAANEDRKARERTRQAERRALRRA